MMDRKSFFLFANLDYGMSFIEMFSLLANKHNKSHSFTLVISGKYFKIKFCKIFFCLQAMKILRSRIKLKQSLKRDLKNPHLRIKIVDDINAMSFIQGIPKNAFGIISGFNQICKSELILSFSSLVNFHPSILPYYKGPVPSYWCIRHKEKFTGYSLHKVTTKIDSGEILYQETIKILEKEKPHALDRRIAKLASIKLKDYLVFIINEDPFPVKEINPKTVYQKEVGYLSFPK